MKGFFPKLIRLYQLCISPIVGSLGGGCRFYPTCSDYSRDAFRRHPLLKALALSAWRVVRCNPLNPGGIDMVK